MVLTTKKVLFFDLDGTLTDPKVGITKSVAYALKKILNLDEDPDDLTAFIGPPLKEAFMDFYEMSDQEALKAIAFYRERYSDLGWCENAVYPGVQMLLEDLKNQGLTLVVATSKPTVFAEKILKHFQLDTYFDHIVGSNLDGTRSHKYEVLNHAISLVGQISKDHMIMIGDRQHDIIGAHKCGIPCIGVGYGYGSKAEHQEHSVDVYVESVEALKEALIPIS